MSSRTPSPLIGSDEDANHGTAERAQTIPELERSPFPPVIEPDRTGMVVSSRRVNRRVTKRRISPFRVLLILFSAAVAIVLYVGNVIAVGNLLADINSLENRHTELLMEKERLQFEIRQLSSLERIRDQAETELGLKVVREAPTWISIDRQKIGALEEAAANHHP